MGNSIVAKYSFLIDYTKLTEDVHSYSQVTKFKMPEDSILLNIDKDHHNLDLIHFWFELPIRSSTSEIRVFRFFLDGQYIPSGYIYRGMINNSNRDLFIYELEQ